MDFHYFPVVVENHGVFHTADPWDEGRLREWRLVGYQMHTTTIHPPYPPKKGSAHDVMMGIEAADGRRYRVLPLALQPLFHNGEIPAEKIPALLHRIEGKLRSSDYPPRRAYTGLAITYLVFGAVVYAGAYAASSGSDRMLTKALFWCAHGIVALSSLVLALSLLTKLRRHRIGQKARRILREL
ncbi:hypothetical protein F183_A13150 [Bryobacterales bacterium F-183]|nr:hypothetical protein F183_A13150 [Bryobacterales bacterium F-183]